MIKEENWYAVYTRPRWEKKVSELLTRKGIKNYCPVNRVYRQWSDRKKKIYEPLFISYVFVRIQKADYLRVLRTDGIINFVYWLNKPAAIREEEIETIKHFLNEHDNVRLEKVPVKIDSEVQVISGPFMEMNGQVVALKNNNTAKVLLPSLGYLMYVETERSNLVVRTDFNFPKQESI